MDGGRGRKHLARLDGCHGNAESLFAVNGQPRAIASTCHEKTNRRGNNQSIKGFLAFIAFHSYLTCPRPVLAMLLILASLPCTMRESS